MPRNESLVGLFRQSFPLVYYIVLAGKLSGKSILTRPEPQYHHSARDIGQKHIAMQE